MFTSQSTPFKFASFKKNLFSKENKNTLLTSYDCIHWESTVMAGMYADGDIVLCKKIADGSIVTEEGTFQSKKLPLDLEQFIILFHRSEGIDFVVFDLSPYFLITRQLDNRVNVFMTTSNRFVEIFTDPAGFFGEYEERNTNIDTVFSVSSKMVKKLKKQKSSKLVSDLANLSLSSSAKQNNVEPKSKDGNINGSSKNDISADTIDNNIPEVTTEKSVLRESLQSNPISSPRQDSSVMLAIGNIMSDQEFDSYIENNKNFAVVRYGNLKDGVIEFTRQPMLYDNTEGFADIVKFFSYSSYDYVEILGEFNIAGVRKDGQFFWFAEVEKDCIIPTITIVTMMFLFGSLTTREDSSEDNNKSNGEDADY